MRNQKLKALSNSTDAPPDVGTSYSADPVSSLRSWLLRFTAMVFILSIFDLDVFLLEIPKFNDLTVSEGIVAFDLTPLGRGSSLYLLDKGRSIKLSCWIKSTGVKDCVPKETRKFYVGKNAKAWWYEARINVFSVEKRLLQLEVDGNSVLNYSDQRKLYYGWRDNYLYIWPVAFIVMIFMNLLLLFANRSNRKQG